MRCLNGMAEQGIRVCQLEGVWHHNGLPLSDTGVEIEHTGKHGGREW